MIKGLHTLTDEPRLTSVFEVWSVEMPQLAPNDCVSRCLTSLVVQSDDSTLIDSHTTSCLSCFLVSVKILLPVRLHNWEEFFVSVSESVNVC